MKTNDEIYAIAHYWASRFQGVNFEELPISDYNKRYIRNLKPAFMYYMRIYADCLIKGLQQEVPHFPIGKITMVDFGGGSGFLSILAKSLGVGRVIYIDHNPSSVETIRILTEIVGMGPDDILQGDENRLCDWCQASNIQPQLLIGTDVIEHIFSLHQFFENMNRVNPSMHMLFTTASNPYNPFIQFRLRKMMRGCEIGTLESPNYYTLRKAFIQELRPNFSSQELDRWAKRTRGMIYPQIKFALSQNSLPQPKDSYNTCDPATGNWAERILPIAVYKELLQPFGLTLKVEKGFYNIERNSSFLTKICKGINGLIQHSGAFGFILAPFIILSCGKK